MEAFLAIALIVSLAYVGTSKRTLRFRAVRVVSMLISGGWIWIGVGVALGPRALGAIGPDVVLPMTPLVAFALGWVGLMVGLQAQRGVLASLPGSVRRASALDLVASGAAFALVCAVGMWLWTGTSDPGLIAPAVGLLVACSLGWAMETRSLRSQSPTPAETRLALLIRAAGGLGAIGAIAVRGTMGVASRGGGASAAPMSPALALLIIAGLAVVVALLARLTLRIADGRRADMLTVFIGLVALVSGVALTLHVPPIFAAMLAGIAMANLPGVAMRQFERFLLQAEHVVAVMLALLAGLLLDPVFGWGGLALAVAMASLRLGVKPAIVSMAIRDSEAASGRSPLRFASVRQSPVALALAVGFALAEPSVLSRQILGVVVLAGLLSETIPLAIGWAMGRRRGRGAVGSRDAQGAAA